LSFSFEKGAEAFDLPFDSATELQIKVHRVSPLRRIIHFRSKSGGEKRSVQVHAEITQATNERVSNICLSEMTVDPLLHREMQLPSKVYKESAYKQG